MTCCAIGPGRARSSNTAIVRSAKGKRGTTRARIVFGGSIGSMWDGSEFAVEGEIWRAGKNVMADTKWLAMIAIL